MDSINYLAVLAATVAGMVVGALWYSPILLGKQWMAAIGKTPEELGNPAKAMAGQLVTTLIVAVVLAIVVAWSGRAGLIGGATVGLTVWLGFVLTALLPSVFFEGRPSNLVAINGSCQLVTYAVMGAIIGVM